MGVMKEEIIDRLDLSTFIPIFGVTHITQYCMNKDSFIFYCVVNAKRKTMNFCHMDILIPYLVLIRV